MPNFIVSCGIENQREKAKNIGKLQISTRIYGFLKGISRDIQSQKPIENSPANNERFEPNMKNKSSSENLTKIG